MPAPQPVQPPGSQVSQMSKPTPVTSTPVAAGDSVHKFGDDGVSPLPGSYSMQSYLNRNPAATCELVKRVITAEHIQCICTLCEISRTQSHNFHIYYILQHAGPFVGLIFLTNSLILTF